MPNQNAEAIDRHGGHHAPGGRVPGEVGVWTFVGGDLLVFLLFFLTYLYYRSEDLALFQASRMQLNQAFGIANTFILLTSSYLVASAIHMIRVEKQRPAKLLLWAACACGAAFVVNKIFEYGEKLSSGITPTTNDFFNMYFMLTGIHLFHVLVGLVVLLLLVRHVDRTPVGQENMVVVESGGIFWHLVDLIWIILFALLYILH